METITRREAILAAVGASLPDDSTARLLERDFTQPHLSYLLLDVPSRRVIASRWQNSKRPVPVGSLVKPFVAFAYRARFPEITCHGCWKAAGHGRMQLPLAIAHSCNAYFLELARDIDPTALTQLGLSVPAQATPQTWIGMGEGWPIAPLTLVNAYCELLARSCGADSLAVCPRTAMILQGMRLSAKLGTAREIRCDAYGKTGTAPCHHEKRRAGDGYAMALYPASAPRVALLVSVDGAPGSHAARLAGDILRTIE